MSIFILFYLGVAGIQMLALQRFLVPIMNQPTSIPSARYSYDPPGIPDIQRESAVNQPVIVHLYTYCWNFSQIKLTDFFLLQPIWLECTYSTE